MIKLKKRRKSSRMHGRGMGSHGWGARKKHLGSGHRGGVGMSGSGKKAGQKISMLKNLYENKYFGKQGVTSRGTAHKVNKVMNLDYISSSIEQLKKKYVNKEGILDLSDYKILGDGEIKIKLTIKAKAASKSAIEKINKAGGKVILPEALVPRKVIVNKMKGEKVEVEKTELVKK